MTVNRLLFQPSTSTFTISRPGFDVSDANIDNLMVKNGIILNQPILSVTVASLAWIGQLTWGVVYTPSAYAGPGSALAGNPGNGWYWYRWLTTIYHGLGYVPVFRVTVPGGNGGGSATAMAVDTQNFYFYYDLETAQGVGAGANNPWTISPVFLMVYRAQWSAS